MAKSTKPVASPFDALIQARQQTAKQLNSQTAKQVIETPSNKLAKSVDPNYLKFTTYIRKDTHRALKVKLVEQEGEMSELVEELLSNWLQKQSQIT